MNVLDGEKVAREIREDAAGEVEKLQDNGVEPGLATVLVGEDPASKTYVSRKQEACEEAGIKSFDIRMSEDTGQQEIEQKICELNQREDVHGILIQLPLPDHLDKWSVLSRIDPVKDVDGLQPENMGRLASGHPRFEPCTPKGIIRLLDHHGIEMEGKDAVVVGESEIVGRPMTFLFVNREVNTTVIPAPIPDLGEKTREADILVVAAGQPGLVDGSMVAEGATVIDVGINRVEEDGGSIVGDVKFGEVKSRASHITPVPGGVGPMTVSMLLENTVKAARIQQDLEPDRG